MEKINQIEVKESELTFRGQVFTIISVTKNDDELIRILCEDSEHFFSYKDTEVSGVLYKSVDELLTAFNLWH
jgi:hypothetical protein